MVNDESSNNDVAQWIYWKNMLLMSVPSLAFGVKAATLEDVMVGDCIGPS